MTEPGAVALLRSSAEAGSGYAGGVHFGHRVVLSKEEAFGACQALADAGRHLVRGGAPGEADALGTLFELIEERLVRQ